MNRKIVGALLLAQVLWGLEVPIDEVEKQIFKENIRVNSKIVQLRSAKESVMARVGGKVIKYLVKQGESVKRGDAIALIESLELSKLSSKLKLLRKQLVIHNRNYKILKNLYNTGLESLEKLNREERERDQTVSEIESIKAQLRLLGVKSRGKIKSTYTVYAQGSGKVAEILMPRNSVVDVNTPLVSIVKGGASFLVKSYVPLNYVSEVEVGQRGELLYGGKQYKMHISQILPELDEETQQIQVLSTLDELVKNLFVNAYVESKLFIGEAKEYLAVKKSALSFFNNEWVVFTSKHHDEEEAHEEHHEEEHHEAKEGHHEHEEVEVPYDINVVKIITQNDKFVAIEGLDEHSDYVSDKSYYIKSLLLKSSLGGHGH
jgi:biotin carboxyl carrier protein